MSELDHQVDVLVVGAGPVGLVTAFQLVKFGVSVAIIEQYEKSVQDAYGRAITLFPRTSEMLDQLGLAEDLAQQCFACRDTATYNAKGEEVQGRGWSFMETGMDDTSWNFALVLRQKYQEDVFRGALRKYGVEVKAPVAIKSVNVDDNVPVLEGRITATVECSLTGKMSRIKCKYLIGCDGGRSSVRRMMGIPFNGTNSEDKWVRVDGVVETNLPKPRTYCSIESPTHGNVLWVRLDRGRTRIGYAFTDARANPYEKFDEAAAVQEAIAAVKPFDLSFKSVDWWTIYAVGQRIAESFFVKDCVFLAGDACHTHSSGAAQGMNTGIHDSVNLAWKLSLVLREKADVRILNTYQSERLPNVQKLIQYDKDISRLMTNRLPEHWTGDPNADVNAILGKIMSEAASFSSGLGISYQASEESLLSVPSDPGSNVQLSVSAGQRAPDIALLKPGTFERTRLITQTPNTAKFYCLVFVDGTQASGIGSFVEAVEHSSLLSDLRDQDTLDFVTIFTETTASAFELMGREPLGRTFFDCEGAGHRRYGIGKGGAVVLLRPDGWIALSAAVKAASAEHLVSYFERFCKAH